MKVQSMWKMQQQQLDARARIATKGKLVHQSTRVRLVPLDDVIKTHGEIPPGAKVVRDPSDGTEKVVVVDRFIYRKGG